jgi:hypothetical protein
MRTSRGKSPGRIAMVLDLSAAAMIARTKFVNLMVR